VSQRPTQPPLDGIAVIAMTGRFPGARSVEELWDHLAAGRETIRHFSDAELEREDYDFLRNRDNPNYVKARGILDDVEGFDAGFFGMTPREAEITDPQHRLFLECCWEALERAGYAPEKFGGSIGVYGGMSRNTYFMHNLYSNRDRVALVNTYQAEMGNEKDYLTTRVSYKFNLSGPSVSVHTACSTSLVAVVQACQGLLNFQCDLALAGGVSVRVPQARGYLYQDGFITSPDGHTRSFDARAGGTVFSNGVGVVALKRLEDAVADRDPIYAVIKGSALNNDGSQKVSFTAPSVDRQAEVISMAQAVAGFDPETVTYIEAHGTGTLLGDPIEVAALTRAFRAGTDARRFCALTSLKSNIGHLDAAAGVAGLIKTCLALRHRQIPASLHFESPNPELDLDTSPFFVNTELRDWKAGPTPRRAGVSSFGVGGTNAHVVLEEAPECAPSGPSRPWQLLAVSARSEQALEQATRNLAAHLRAHPEQPLADVAFTLQQGRKAFSHRRVVVCAQHDDGAAALESLDPKRVFTQRAAEATPSIVFMFPGQGAQHVQMGRALYQDEPLFRAEVDQGAEILEPLLGVDLRSLLYPAPGREEWAAGQLKQTVITQPALFVIEHALARLWMAWGIEPQAMIGHSVGEYVAAVLAGVFSKEDGLKLLAERARLMQSQPGGSMLAVRLPEEEVLAQLNDGLSLAACNAPSLCVVSGPTESIQAFAQKLSGLGVGTRELHTSHAFHSAMMEPLLAPFTEKVRQTHRRPPERPFISSLTGAWISAEEATDPAYWARQLRQTVRFSPGLRELQKEENRLFLEVGPSRTLSTLAQQHGGPNGRHQVVASLPHAQEPRDDLACLLEALGRVWLAGGHLDAARLFAGEQRARVCLPTYPFERQRCWIDPPRAEAVHVLQTEAGPIPGEEEEAPASAGTEAIGAPAAATRLERLRERLKIILNELSGINFSPADAQSGFMELGLDSLLLTQVTARLQKDFGVRVSFRQLLEDVSSLDALAAHLDQILPASSDVVRPGAPAAESRPAAAPAAPAAPGQRFGPYKPIERARDDGLTPAQRKHLDDLIGRINRKTGGSKEYAQRWRAVLADPRAVAGFRLLWKEMVYQVVVNRSQGARLWDIDGNEYVDLSMCFGANLLGYSPPFIVEAIENQLRRGIEIGPQAPLAGEVAQLICELTGMERVSFCNTGSEAVMAALRVARTVTGRSRIVYFTGDYHGIFEEALGRASPGGVLPAAPGIPPEALQNATVLEYGSPEALAWIEQHAGELAAVLVEPVRSRFPHEQPVEFLRAVREATARHDVALIFDELVTGFRVHPGGCQAAFGIQADLATYGKILGGGLPIGAVTGRARYMNALDGGPWRYGDASVPEADVTFFAGTFVRHPLALAAARAVLQHLKQAGPGLQEKLNRRTEALALELNGFFEQQRVPMRVTWFASLLRFMYPPELTFANLAFYHMIEKGLYIRDTAQNCFLCAAHGDEELAFISRVIKESVLEAKAAGFLPASAEAESKLPRQAPAPATPADAGDRLAIPLTDAQREIWLATQMGGDAGQAYNESLGLTLKGPFHLEAFRSAVDQTLARHEIIRATISPDGEDQRIRPDLAIPVRYEDLSGHPDGERAAQYDALVKRESRSAFDLARGPLLRIVVVKWSDAEHRVLWVTHHLICDGWSNWLLLDEIGRLYTAERTGRPAELDPPAAYRDFAVWQVGRRDRPEVRATLDYWLGQFKELPPPLDLPTDRPRPSLKTYRGHTLRWAFAPATYQNARRLAAGQKTTLVVLLLAALKALFYRLSGKDDIVIGLTSAGQPLFGQNTLVGHCVNLLPIRSRLRGDLSFREHLAAVRRATLDGLDHQECTFVNVLEHLALPRDPSRLPLVEIIFNVDKDSGDLQFHDLEARLEQNPKSSTNFDAFFSFIERPDGLHLNCDYNTDLWDESTLQRWCRHLETLLNGLAQNPDLALDAVPLLTEEEQRTILGTWNETRMEYRRDRCVHHLVEEEARRRPDAPAVECGTARLTAGELDRRSNQLARHLQGMGVGLETLVGLYMDRSADMLVAILGIWKAGGAYLPLDPAFPRERLAYMLKDSAAPVLITQRSLVEDQELPAGPARVVDLEADGPGLLKLDDGPVDGGAGPEHLAYLLYTSGSTGRPKGVEIPHRALVNFLESMKREPGLCSSDALLAVTTLSFDIAGLELYLPLLCGARVVIARRDEAVDGRRLIEMLDRHRITVMQATPATWRLLLEAGWTGTPDLKILCGGEALPRELADALRTRAAEVWNLYGPTETTIWSTVHPVGPDEAGAVVSIGRPIANTQVYILDRMRRPVPVGVPGDLFIGGDGLARGYLNQPELTAERFAPNPFSPAAGARMYWTGDLARYRADGRIEFLGRQDFQVKVRGYRIELGEIEEVLGRHPAVGQAVVAARDDEAGQRVLVAYLVARDGEPAVADLREHLRRQLPEYMVPSHFLFLPELPLTPNRKVDRKALPAPDRQPVRTGMEFVGARDDLERQLVELWRRVLGIEKVGVHDNFFELGGHSMKAVRMFVELEKQTGRRLPLATLFQAPTIEQLAARLRQGDHAAAWSTLVPISAGGSRPPFFCVHGAGGNVLLYRDLARRLGPDQPFYGLQARGLDGNSSPHTRIEDMAEDYLKEIRAFQPNGPYCLGGYCMGGNIAFEIARRLEERGAEVALLALFDTQFQWRTYPPAWRMFHQVQRVLFHLGNLLLIGPGGQAMFVGEKLRETGRRMRRYLQSIPAMVRRAEGGTTGASLAQLQQINDRAAVAYRPRPYGGRVTLFRPRALYAGESDAQLGWRPEVARGGIEVHGLNVYPAGMLVEPFVRELAAALKPCLDRALAASGRPPAEGALT
jgi:amino acid adenylation domain-containing protein